MVDSLLADREGALRCFEGLGLLHAFRRDGVQARATFKAGLRRWKPTSRYLREFALFEKRQECYQVLNMGFVVVLQFSHDLYAM